MTFPPDDEYGELLRRALRAEADSVVPSPDGLEIIRRRIDQRGLRGLRNLLWWRVGASAAGAVLVAGAVVMLVPDLRDQVAQKTGITAVGSDREQLPDTSTVTRPPNAPSTHPGVIVLHSPSPSRPRPTPTPTQRTGATTRPTPSASDPCAGATSAGVIEPEQTPAPTPPAAPTCQPAERTEQPATPSPTRHTPAPSSAPPATATTTATPTPAPTETATTDSATETPAS